MVDGEPNPLQSPTTIYMYIYSGRKSIIFEIAKKYIYSGRELVTKTLKNFAPAAPIFNKTNGLDCFLDSYRRRRIFFGVVACFVEILQLTKGFSKDFYFQNRLFTS